MTRSLHDRVALLEKTTSKATVIGAVAAALSPTAAAAVTAYFTYRLGEVEDARASASQAIQKELEALRASSAANLETIRAQIAKEQRSTDDFRDLISQVSDPDKPVRGRFQSLQLAVDRALTCDQANQVAGLLSTLGIQDTCNAPCDQLQPVQAVDCYNACADAEGLLKAQQANAGLCGRACADDADRRATCIAALERTH